MTVEKPSDDIANAVDEAARRFDLPSSLIRTVIAVESAGDVHAVSPKGAIGLMQLMPNTYAEMQQVLGLGADPFDIHDNIMAGAAYLRRMLDRFGVDGFLAAYNTGPERYLDHLATGRPLPEETRSYIAKVTSVIVGLHRDVPLNVFSNAKNWAKAPLFVERDAVNLASRPQSYGTRSVRNLTVTPSPRKQPDDGLFIVQAERKASQ